MILTPMTANNEQLRAALHVLEKVAANHTLLTSLSPEEYARLRRAAGDVFLPDLKEKRRFIKARIRQQKVEKIARQQTVLNQTGIRELRRRPVFNTPDPLPAPAAHAVLDSNGAVKPYPLYKPTRPDVFDGAVTQECGAAADANGLPCGNWSINTSLPAFQPTASYGPQLPLIDDTTKDLNIGDRMSDAGISWAWYSGGWDNAAGNVGGRGYTNGPGPACGDPESVPAGPDIDGANAGYPYCPHRTFQQHHQPFGYFARYAPGTVGRAKHLKDEEDFLHQARTGHLPKVSFVKPIGEENEHPGYASVSAGQQHLVNLLKAIAASPQADSTAVVVTYDEFGGQWDHVPPPGLGGTVGPHDEWGPGTRVPALVISPFLRDAFVVDHTQYDTTSILATIEQRFGLGSLSSRDAAVAGLPVAVGLYTSFLPMALYALLGTSRVLSATANKVSNI
jgi:acid phosphatase